MANLSKDQIDELKNLGIITTVDNSNDLANQTVDSLKNSKFVTITDSSAVIESAITSPEPDPEPGE